MPNDRRGLHGSSGGFEARRGERAAGPLGADFGPFLPLRPEPIAGRWPAPAPANAAVAQDRFAPALGTGVNTGLNSAAPLAIPRRIAGDRRVLAAPPQGAELNAQQRGVRLRRDAARPAIDADDHHPDPAINLQMRRQRLNRLRDGEPRAQLGLPPPLPQRGWDIDWDMHPANFQARPDFAALRALEIRLGHRREPAVAPAAARRSRLAPADNALQDAVMQAAPAPFAEVHRLRLHISDLHRVSIATQLRFFAAMEGPAQAFCVQANIIDASASEPLHFVPDTQATTMKAFVAACLHNKKLGLFSLKLHEGRTKVQIHGEHNPCIGLALSSLSGEFRGALNLAYDRGRACGSHVALERLFEAIGSWCFDASINKLNQFLQESDLTEQDLSLVPNLDGKPSPDLRAGEYARVFALYQARRFERELGTAARTPNGSYAQGFASHYLNGAQFLNYLRTHESGSLLTETERTFYLTYVTEVLALF